MTLSAKPAVYLSAVQLFPDVNNKLVVAKVQINSLSGNMGPLKLLCSVLGNKGGIHLPILQKTVAAGKDSAIVFQMILSPSSGS